MSDIAEGQAGDGLWWHDNRTDEERANDLDEMRNRLAKCPSCGRAEFWASVPYWMVQCAGKVTVYYDWPEDALDEWNETTVKATCEPDAE